jgi:hypothetical protein
VNRTKWISLLLAVVVLALFASIGPSPLPPRGPMGGHATDAPADRLGVVSDVTNWLAGEVDGRAIEFYNMTWEGGETPQAIYAPGTALYTGFKGAILVGHWPFVLGYEGYVDYNPIGGYRLQVQLDGPDPSQTDPAHVPAAARSQVLAMVPQILALSGVGTHYRGADVAGWTTFAKGPDGLVADAPLVLHVTGAREGELQIGLSKDLEPMRVVVDTIVEQQGQ